MKTENREWTETCERFVAYFDILGFKDMVQKESHLHVLQKLRDLANLKYFIEGRIFDKIHDENLQVFKNGFLLNNDEELSSINTIIFSDTIVMVTKDSSAESFKLFVDSVGMFFSIALTMLKLPIKGALSYGEVSIMANENLIFGKPIIDAYLLENEVDYCGIVCHNSIEQYLLKFNTQIELSNFKNSFADKFIKELTMGDFVEVLFVDFKTHFKTGKLTHCNYNWYFYSLSFLKEYEIIATLESIRKGTSGAPRKYIDNTLEILSHFKNIIMPKHAQYLNKIEEHFKSL